MQFKTLLAASLLFGTGLTAASQANAVPDSQRLTIEPAAHAHDPEDDPAPSASERLAARGGSTLRVGSDGASCDFDSLSDALSAASDGDTILLEDNDALYLGDTYGLTNRGVTIRGGYDDCTDTSPSGRTTLDAAGTGRVFDFWLQPSATGEMNVVLENLTITGGATSTSLGGAGMVVEGRQGLLAVELKNVEVSDNHLSGDNNNGGGIRIRVNGDAEGNARLLEIDNDSIIESNTTAGNGGGLACDNPDNFDHDQTILRIGAIEIAGNAATNGGGLAFDNCRNVFIYGGGPIAFLIPTGAIFGNEASEKGGGIYMTGTSVVAIRGSQFDSFGDPEHAAHIVFNDAELGGGIYTEALAANLDDVVINGNEASEDGGGIYADGGGIVRHRREQDAPCEPAESSGGTTTVPRCSRMTGNTAATGAGGGYYVTNGTSLDVDRTIITGNESDDPGSVVRSTDDGSNDPGVANFRDVLVHGNTGSHLFYAWQTSEINVAWSTITDNEIGLNALRAWSSGSSLASIDVVSSIVWEDDGGVLTTGGEGEQEANADCVIAHEDAGETGFDSTNFYSNIDPMLTTVDDKPYFPSNTSPAIDYCDGMNAEDDEIDLVGVERGSEHEGPDPVEPPSSVTGGTLDIGAYETEWGPLTDEVFHDRFEAD